jgi:hypothetical protein
MAISVKGGWLLLLESMVPKGGFLQWLLVDTDQNDGCEFSPGE